MTKVARTNSEFTSPDKQRVIWPIAMLAFDCMASALPPTGTSEAMRPEQRWGLFVRPGWEGVGGRVRGGGAGHQGRRCRGVSGGDRDDYLLAVIAPDHETRRIRANGIHAASQRRVTSPKLQYHGCGAAPARGGAKTSTERRSTHLRLGPMSIPVHSEPNSPMVARITCLQNGDVVLTLSMPVAHQGSASEGLRTPPKASCRLARSTDATTASVSLELEMGAVSRGLAPA